MTRTALLASALALAACDSQGPTVAPTATLTVDVLTATALGDCDDGDNPNDFQIQVEARGVAGTLGSVTLPSQVPYGTWGGTDGANFVQLRAPQSATFDAGFSFQTSRDSSGAFRVVARAIEWDGGGRRDSRMDDVQQSFAHEFAGGTFSTVGRTVQLQIPSVGEACDLIVQYVVVT